MLYKVCGFDITLYNLKIFQSHMYVLVIQECQKNDENMTNM